MCTPAKVMCLTDSRPLCQALKMQRPCLATIDYQLQYLKEDQNFESQWFQDETSIFEIDPINFPYFKSSYYCIKNKPESEFSPIPRAKSTYSNINTLKTFQMYQLFSTRQGLILSNFEQCPCFEYIYQNQSICKTKLRESQFIFKQNFKMYYNNINSFLQSSIFDKFRQDFQNKQIY